MMIQPVTMSGEKSANANITARACILSAIDLTPPATGAVILKIYDDAATATSGTIIFETSVIAGVNALNFVALNRYAVKGLYAVLSGTYTGTPLFNIGFVAQ